jgi:chromosomal replication initiator protein
MANRGDDHTRLSPKALTGVTDGAAPRERAARVPSGDTTSPSAPSQLAAQWAAVRGRLQSEVGDVEYRTWLKQMTLVGLEGDEVTIRVPTRFLRDWVREHYGDLLARLWQKENPGVRRIALRWGGGGQEAGLAESVAPAQVAAAAAAAAAEDRAAEAGLLDPRFTFESFVVGKPNEFAHACARQVAASPATKAFNPLFLYGGVGLGKTHLMHAIAWELRGGDGSPPNGNANGNGNGNGTGNGNGGAPRARPVEIAYMSAERFMTRFIAAIRAQRMIEFKEQLRRVDVLMVDDLQFLMGKDATQEEFFHTFNALVDAGKQIVVSADKSPSDLSGFEERVRTRLGSGIVANLHATTLELRMSILGAKAARAGVEVPPKVIEYLAQKITSNIRELEGALNRLVAHANLFGRPITLDVAQELLHDILRAHERRVSIEEIQRKVADHYRIRFNEMTSQRRARNIARPRQVAMYLAKQLTSRSLPDIGKRFGDRDHTTVMHAVGRVTALMETDAAFAEDVELLRRMLES